MTLHRALWLALMLAVPTGASAQEESQGGAGDEVGGDSEPGEIFVPPEPAEPLASPEPAEPPASPEPAETTVLPPPPRGWHGGAFAEPQRFEREEIAIDPPRRGGSFRLRIGDAFAGTGAAFGGLAAAGGLIGAGLVAASCDGSSSGSWLFPGCGFVIAGGAILGALGLGLLVGVPLGVSLGLGDGVAGLGGFGITFLMVAATVGAAWLAGGELLGMPIALYLGPSLLIVLTPIFATVLAGSGDEEPEEQTMTFAPLVSPRRDGLVVGVQGTI